VRNSANERATVMANSFLHIEGRDSREPARRMVMASFSFTLALLLPQDQSNIPTLSPPGLSPPRRCAPRCGRKPGIHRCSRCPGTCSCRSSQAHPHCRAAVSGCIRSYDLASGIASGPPCVLSIEGESSSA